MSKRRKTPAALAGPADVLAGRWPWCVENDSALGALPRLPAGAFHVCCTSPPYYALRSYEGVSPASWPAVEYVPMAGLAAVRVPEMLACLGNEPTPEAYVAHLVLIFREVWRVLRDGATLWLNLGDSYASGETGRKDAGRLERDKDRWRDSMTDQPPRSERRLSLATGVPAKNLLGIPSRVAFALQADGWHWRQTISWQKLAPMPASVRDRPTSATEEIFLLSKGERYFYDLDACRVPSAAATIERDKYSRVLDDPDEQCAVAHDHEFTSHAEGRNLWNWWDVGEDDAGDQPAKLRWLLAHERCHFFAGIGGWDYALALAGWPADRPVWTASLPCQPFSAAGKRKGQADERHLWPVFLRLVRDGQPATCFGEQVASDDGYRWLARVRDDLEEAGYAVGAADLPACCAGAPHIRQRLFWVASRLRPSDAQRTRFQREGRRLAGASGDEGIARDQPPRAAAHHLAVGDTGIARRWDAYDVLDYRDGKRRRIEPGTFPLAHGVHRRLVKLRGYGNAIVPEVAAVFVRAYLDAEAAGEI
jgi:DNA (cytosine-5)-methyltransferase 1